MKSAKVVSYVWWLAVLLTSTHAYAYDGHGAIATHAELGVRRNGHRAAVAVRGNQAARDRWIGLPSRRIGVCCSKRVPD